MDTFDDILKGNVWNEKDQTSEDLIRQFYNRKKDYVLSEIEKVLNIDFFPILSKNEKLKNLIPNDVNKIILKRLGYKPRIFFEKTSVIAQCEFNIKSQKQRFIKFNFYFIKNDNNFDKNMKDIISHEISHALCEAIFFDFNKFNIETIFNKDPEYYLKQGHGSYFFEICKTINKDGICNITYKDYSQNLYDTMYVYNCVNCGYNGTLFYYSKFQKCEKCNKAVLLTKKK
ncbi:MAG: hypothetical protein QXM96_00755 [Candidatus Woesearchaeota archaeon]